jgi:crotonobetainyl-CoA:carnitine CoA-transferase CaiB-like acyl-CoA transferase
MASQCLSDVRVIDLSHVIAGPVASMYLAALGADVLKVENPRAPDVMRFVEPGREAMSNTFATLNAGKKSLAIDLKVPRLRNVLLELVRDADVFIENFKPGTATRLGFDYATLRAINPRIVYLSISGYGQTGPWSRFGAYDQVVQALTGMMMANGEEDGPPTKVGFPVVDIATGMLGAMSVLAALHRRGIAGLGSHIDTSLAQAALQLMRPLASRVLSTERDGPRPGNRGFSGSPGAATFRCADGWLAVAANTRRQFTTLCDLLGLAGLAEDPAMVTQVGDGAATNVVPVDAAELGRRLDAAFARHGAAAMEARLNDAGVPAARVRRMGEFLREARAGRHVELGLERLQDAFLQLGPGFTRPNDDDAATTPAPPLGTSTEEILLRAGFAAEEIDRLVRDGAIRV